MSDIRPNEILDLKGVPCPMNFVKTKLKLEGMAKGAILEVILDDGDPIKNVPASVRDEGHKVLKVEKINNHWRVLVRRS